MDEYTFKQQLAALTTKINALPEADQKKLNDLLQQTQIRRNTINNNMSKIKAALDDIRLNIKYLVYDLEMTKKEYKKYRHDNQTDTDNT